MSWLWNCCGWVGVATLTVLGLWLLHGVIEDFIVARIGWTRLGTLGFWRAIPAAIRRQR